MNSFIIEGLDIAFGIAIKATPKTKKITKSLSISEVNPIDLATFMVSNNVPNNAYFDGKDNGYDAFDEILISWDIEIPTTTDDKLIFQKEFFERNAISSVKKRLTEEGYEMGFKCSRNKHKSIFDMYVNREFDKLFEYYNDNYNINLK